MADSKPQGEGEKRVRVEDISSGELQLTEEERRLDRETLVRLDLLLMPLTLILYLLAWLDRANVGNARIVSLLI
jgi:hypothetical protein